ncbi:MAG: tRNA (guanosine(37)-N1)-methyltransferase TrmD [Actinobacteria bacterium]|nr:tRNA (guanosine(37)-N1)-methyltransferase TrmD [Actinomycetota bacterium]
MKIDIVTIFPEYFAPLSLSLLGKAQDDGLLSIDTHNLRNHAPGVHKSVDDTPYGGGAGMVMMAEPIAQAIDPIVEAHPRVALIIPTPSGKKFTQEKALQLSKKEHLLFLCGRYEGIDARVPEYYRNVVQIQVEELSLGDYVLAGGEVASLAMIEAITRLIPGVLGNPDSLVEESHVLREGSGEELLVEYPNYTKPPQWRGLDVPEILTSGNHGEIARWRLEQAKARTARDFE